MGKLSQFIAGLFVAGAGYALRLLHSLIVNQIGQPEAAPIDIGMVIDLASKGFMGIGALLVGYTLIAGIGGFLWKHLASGGEDEPEQPQRQPPGQQQRRQPPGQQQQPQNQQRQQQRQPRQNPPPADQDRPPTGQDTSQNAQQQNGRRQDLPPEQGQRQQGQSRQPQQGDYQQRNDRDGQDDR